MTTKAASEVNFADPDSRIKRLYSAIEEMKEIVPVENDRNRLSFTLNMYLEKEINTVYDAIVQAKPGSSVDYKALEELVLKKFKEKGIK